MSDCHGSDCHGWGDDGAGPAIKVSSLLSELILSLETSMSGGYIALPLLTLHPFLCPS